MSYILLDKNGNKHEINSINIAGRTTVTRPSDVVVSFTCATELPLAEYEVQPSLPHDSLKIIRRISITKKVRAGNGVYSYVTTAVQ